MKCRTTQPIRNATRVLCVGLLLCSNGALAQSRETGTLQTPRALDGSSKEPSVSRQRLKAIQDTCARTHQRGTAAWRSCIIEMN